jgi:hypothetical protein
MPFQTAVSTQPRPAVAGDFCDANPRSSVQAGQGFGPGYSGLRAGANGVTIGAFAWWDTSTSVDPSTGPIFVNNAGAGQPTGFVHREQQGLITTYLSEAGMVIPAGMPVVLMDTGGYWMTNAGAGAATIGMKAFASLTTGAVSFAAAGGTVAGSIETRWRATSNGLVGELVRTTSTSVGPIGTV